MFYGISLTFLLFQPAAFAATNNLPVPFDCKYSFADIENHRYKPPFEIKDDVSIAEIGTMPSDQFEELINKITKYWAERLKPTGELPYEEIARIQKIASEEELIPGLSAFAEKVLEAGKNNNNIVDFALKLQERLKIQQELAPLLQRKKQLEYGYDGPGLKNLLNSKSAKQKELVALNKRVDSLQTKIFELEQSLKPLYLKHKEYEILLQRLSRAFDADHYIRQAVGLHVGADMNKLGPSPSVYNILLSGNMGASREIGNAIDKKLNSIVRASQIYEKRDTLTELGIGIEKFLGVNLEPNVVKKISEYSQRLEKELDGITDPKRAAAIVRRIRTLIENELKDKILHEENWIKVRIALEKIEDDTLATINKTDKSVPLSSTRSATAIAETKATADKPKNLLEALTRQIKNIHSPHDEVMRLFLWGPDTDLTRLGPVADFRTRLTENKWDPFALVHFSPGDHKPIFFPADRWLDLTPSGKMGIVAVPNADGTVQIAAVRSPSGFKELSNVTIVPIPSIKPVSAGRAAGKYAIMPDQKRVLEITPDSFRIHSLDASNSAPIIIKAKKGIDYQFLGFSENGRFANVGNTVIDLQTNKVIFEPTADSFVASISNKGAVVYSSRGAAGGYARKAFVNFETGDFLGLSSFARQLGKDFAADGAQLSADGRSLFIQVAEEPYNKPTKKLIEVMVKDGKIARTTTLPSDSRYYKISPDGRFAISEFHHAPDRSGYKMYIVDLETDKIIFETEATNPDHFFRTNDYPSVKVKDDGTVIITREVAQPGASEPTRIESQVVRLSEL